MKGFNTMKTLYMGGFNFIKKYKHLVNCCLISYQHIIRFILV